MTLWDLSANATPFWQMLCIFIALGSQVCVIVLEDTAVLSETHTNMHIYLPSEGAKTNRQCRLQKVVGKMFPNQSGHGGINLQGAHTEAYGLSKIRDMSKPVEASTISGSGESSQPQLEQDKPPSSGGRICHVVRFLGVQCWGKRGHSGAKAREAMKNALLTEKPLQEDSELQVCLSPFPHLCLVAAAIHVAQFAIGVHKDREKLVNQSEAGLFGPKSPASY